jgi:hypothetical protein
MLSDERMPSPLTCHLLVPGLLGDVVHRSQGVQDFPRFENLESLLARTRRRSSGGVDHEIQLCALFGLNATDDVDLPLGALRRFGITKQRDPAFFLCADPVYLRADIQRLYLFDSSQLNIQQQEAVVLANLFNNYFNSEGFVLEPTTCDQWHLRLMRSRPIKTHSVRTVRGKAVNAYLPTGKHAMYWQRLLNEAQMLFHDVEPNKRRVTRRELPVNSLWLYGAGTLPKLDNTHWKTVWANDPLVQGLAHLTGVASQPVPESLEALFSAGIEGPQLICLDSLAAPSSYDDFQAWNERMQQLEQNWFRPLIKALKQGQLQAYTLLDGKGQQFDYVGSHRWRFWRKRRPLFAYVNSPNFNRS